MASFHFEIKSGRKGAAADHAAYIARQGYHGKREDLIATDYGNLPAWSDNDPKKFWSAADRNERKNGATYREAIIALPGELTIMQNTALLAELVAKIADDKPFQYALHAPISSLEGELNLHGHVMTSDRVDDGIERPAETFFSRYNPRKPEAGGRKKASGGRNRMELRDELIALRKTVAETINHHLAINGHGARVDHRTLKEQAVPRKAERHLGPARIRRMSAQEKAEYVAVRGSGHGGTA
ncbi:MobA/MobL family protein [Luteibacter sp.]|jgi:hypothetical protein|uniref:MobA/MobL family protein n=1 Tax=Luteibacter sp. TaxID=1886636 RepID=UPI002F3E5646